MEHVGLAMTGPQGVALALESRPGHHPHGYQHAGAEYNGLEAARRILQTYRACIVILTAYADCAEQAAAIGAHGLRRQAAGAGHAACTTFGRRILGSSRRE